MMASVRSGLPAVTLLGEIEMFACGGGVGSPPSGDPEGRDPPQPSCHVNSKVPIRKLLRRNITTSLSPTAEASRLDDTGLSPVKCSPGQIAHVRLWSRPLHYFSFFPNSEKSRSEWRRS